MSLKFMWQTKKIMHDGAVNVHLVYGVVFAAINIGYPWFGSVCGRKDHLAPSVVDFKEVLCYSNGLR